MPSLHGGGAEQTMLLLAEGFLQANQRVSLLLVEASGSLEKAVPKGLDLVTIPGRRVSRAIPHLARYLRQVQPDILLSTLHYANLAAVIARLLSRSRTKVILREATVPSKALDASDSKTRMLKHLLRWLYPRADGIIAISQGTARDLEDLLGSRSKVRTLYNPVVTENFASRAAAPARHPWLSRDENPIVLGIGRLEPVKNFELLIHACAKVFQNKEGRLVILGEGSERAKLEALAERLEISERVSLPGYFPDPLPELARSRALVLTSEWEGFGNVLVQALACGTPVIATACPGGPEEILDGGKHGIIVPAGDLDALAGAISSALDRGMSPASPDAVDEFRFEAAVRAYLEYLGVGSSRGPWDE